MKRKQERMTRMGRPRFCIGGKLLLTDQGKQGIFEELYTPDHPKHIQGQGQRDDEGNHMRISSWARKKVKAQLLLRCGSRQLPVDSPEIEQRVILNNATVLDLSQALA